MGGGGLCIPAAKQRNSKPTSTHNRTDTGGRDHGVRRCAARHRGVLGLQWRSSPMRPLARSRCAHHVDMQYLHQRWVVERLRRTCTALLWIEQLRFAAGHAPCVRTTVHALIHPSQSLSAHMRPRATRVPRRTTRSIGATSLDHGSAALSAALQVVYLLAMDGAVLQQLQMVEDTARARLAARSLAFPAAPAPRPCDSWSQGAALWL